MAPTPKTCMVPGCAMGPEGGPYVTDSGNRSGEEVKEDMNEHRKDHELALKTRELDRVAASEGLQGGETNRPKPAKLERPVLEHGASEADWGMFINRWEQYKRNCKFSDQQEIIDQLWGCLADGLERAAQMDGAGDLTAQQDLKERIKRLAVKQQNTLVSQVRFLQMGQDRDEPVSGFVTRLCGTAQLCDFMVNCSHCQRETSYQEKNMAHQLVRALVDPTIQEKILALAADGKKLSLKEIILAVEAQEIGKRSQGLITGSAGGLNRVSEYRSNKEKPKQQPTDEKCKSCGRKDHKKGADECNAKGKECNKCRKPGHFGFMCESKAKVAAVGQKASGQTTARSKLEHTVEAAASAMTAETGEGSFFCISQGRQNFSAPHHHHVFQEGRWTQRKVKPHPLIHDTWVEVDRESYKVRNIPEPRSTREIITKGLADT